MPEPSRPADGASRVVPPLSGLMPRARRLAGRCWLPLLCLWLAVGCSFPGSVPGTVKLGLSGPFEGLYRGLGYEVLAAVRLAVRQRNEIGPLGGRYLVELVALNDLGEAEEALLQAGEMAADPDILAVLGGWLPETVGAADEYERLGVPFLAPTPDLPRLGQEAAAVAAGPLGLRRAAILYGPDAEDAALVEAFAAALAGLGGSVAGRYAPGDDEAVAPWLAGLQPPPELLFLASDAVSMAEWIAAARRAGFAGAIVAGPELGSPLTVAVAGEASRGVLFVSPYPPASEDPSFVDGFRSLSGGARPGPAATWAYAAAGRLLEAMDAALRAERRPSRDAVARAMVGPPAVPLGAWVYVIRDGDLFAPFSGDHVGATHASPLLKEDLCAF